MYIFDATTLAIMLPSLPLWALIIAAHCHKKQKFQISHGIQFPDVLRRQEARGLKGIFCPTPYVRAQIKIYSLCLSLSGILLLTLNSLFPLQVILGGAAEVFIFSVLTLVSYVFLSVFAIMPLFHFLQTELRKRQVRYSNLQMSKIEHLFLFCTIGLLLLPMCESARAFLGFSPFPFWVTKDIFRACIAFSTIPVSFMGMIVAFKPLFFGKAFKGIRSEQIQSYIEFLKNENFDEERLQFKTEAEIKCIIQIAKQLGDYDKAEIVSESLIQRHLIAS
ncbi:MAG: hypothetical protein SFY67_08710 [Candidatus Melainabacteria bacterium]|nr:hypothetical protein [Candidatus Melainabacteria bacterium]